MEMWMNKKRMYGEGSGGDARGRKRGSGGGGCGAVVSCGPSYGPGIV